MKETRDTDSDDVKNNVDLLTFSQSATPVVGDGSIDVFLLI